VKMAGKASCHLCKALLCAHLLAKTSRNCCRVKVHTVAGLAC
jgi:hypothetical protein